MSIADNYLAGWAHFPVFLWIIGPLVVWPLVKTEYSRYQIKQAFVWQVIWVIMLSVVLVVSYVAYMINPVWGPIFLFVDYALSVVFMAYAIYGAYKTFEGEKFSYPVLHYYIRR